MLWLVLSLKLVAEIALASLLGRWLLGLLIGPARRAENPVYRLLSVLSAPFERLTRRCSPRLVLDRHIPLATLALLCALWLLATAAKLSLCLPLGSLACR
ncbi:UNVERIFIED_ORG: hypothetical protein LHJ69_11215 [Shinella sp. XGS7]|nr:hypothetical protein [Shinella sp. XGS7]